LIKIPEEIIGDIKKFREKVEEYKEGKVDEIRFKTYRVSMGIYEQREKNTYMVRSRIPAGVITMDQFKTVVALAEKYSNGYVHFTTRQDVQFHKVELDNIADIIEGLLEVGIITRGTGGNTARNVICSPLSGVSTDDIFDVIPYGIEATNFLLKDSSTFNLPRKYKIAFSNSKEDTSNATIADLGFIAKIENGNRGFSLFGAGGLGGNSTPGVQLESFIPDSEILYHVQAMKELFEQEGDRSNKNKARIRHILHRIGEKEFKERYRLKVKKAKEEANLDIQVDNDTESNISNLKYLLRDNHLIYTQKQIGKYSVYIHPENGNMTTSNLNKVLSFLDSLHYDTSIVLTNTQGFFVRDLIDIDAKSLVELIKPYIASNSIEQSIACTGASTCQLGLCLSQNLLSAIIKHFKEVPEEVKTALPRIYISGCPNSCGQHYIGEIGLSGKAKRTNKGLIPAYTIYLGGKRDADGAVLAKAFGEVPAKKMPQFVYELAIMKLSLGSLSFEEFVNEHKESVVNLINTYDVIEEDDKDIYYDFGAEEPFTLQGRGPGECSAGVLDVIKLDIGNAEASLVEYKETNESSRLYDATVSGARALLVLKGIDTNRDREILKEFTNHFINTGYVRKSVVDLFESIVDFKLGDLNSLDKYDGDTIYLVSRVKEMYHSLSPQLEITVSKEDKVHNGQLPSTNEIEYKVVDLRGVKCPMNFVKAKIELSKIKGNQNIGFYLDDGDPIQNVPRSIEGEGHTVLSINQNYKGYNLLSVRKKGGS